MFSARPSARYTARRRKRCRWRRRVTVCRSARHFLSGADKVAVPALGLSEPPTEIPMTTHAYALSSHLVYGLTADLVRRAVRKYVRIGENYDRNNQQRKLKKKIDNNDDFILVETLAKETYDHAHLPNAIHLPPDRVAELAPKILPDKSAEIVVYCSSPT